MPTTGTGIVGADGSEIESLDHVASGDPHVSAHNEERDAINKNSLDINKRIVKPSNPPTSSLLIFDGTNWGSGTPRGLKDTGWRDVHNLMQLRGTGACAQSLLRRVGDTVELYLDVTVPTNDTSPWTMLTLPAGFCPDFGRFAQLQANNGQAATGNTVGAEGAVNLLNPAHGVRDRFTAVWTTTVNWPSSLPGDPWSGDAGLT